MDQMLTAAPVATEQRRRWIVRTPEGSQSIPFEYSRSAGEPGARLFADVGVEERLPVVFRRRRVEAVNRIDAVVTRTRVKIPPSLGALRCKRNRGVPPTVDAGSAFVMIVHCCLPITRDRSSANVPRRCDRMQGISVPLPGGLWPGGADGDPFVEVEFDHLNAAPLGLNPSIRASGRRETVGLRSVETIAADMAR